MKNRAFYDRFVDVFLDGQIHGRGPHTVVVGAGPVSVFEKKEGSPEHILRWEDDGGRVFEVQDPLPQPAESNPPPMMDAPPEPRL